MNKEIQEESSRGQRKVRQGIVVSDKMQASAVVMVQRLVRHPMYSKFVRKNKRYLIHDQHNACKPGDEVRIIECRPLSKRKRWRLLENLSVGQKEEGTK